MCLLVSNSGLPPGVKLGGVGQKRLRFHPLGGTGNPDSHDPTQAVPIPIAVAGSCNIFCPFHVKCPTHENRSTTHMSTHICGEYVCVCCCAKAKSESDDDDEKRNIWRSLSEGLANPGVRKTTWAQPNLMEMACIPRWGPPTTQSLSLSTKGSALEWFDHYQGLGTKPDRSKIQ